jgi:hypothetical protein
MLSCLQMHRSVSGPNTNLLVVRPYRRCNYTLKTLQRSLFRYNKVEILILINLLSIHFDCDHSLVTFQLLGYL